MVKDRGELRFKSYYPPPSLRRLGSASCRLSVTVVCFVSLLLAKTKHRGRVYLSGRALRARRRVLIPNKSGFPFLLFLGCPFLPFLSLLQRRLRCWRRAIGFMGEGERGLARSWWGWGEGWEGELIYFFAVVRSRQDGVQV